MKNKIDEYVAWRSKIDKKDLEFFGKEFKVILTEVYRLQSAGKLAESKELLSQVPQEILYVWVSSIPAETHIKYQNILNYETNTETD